MFEPKQIIEGKIFIHQRWAEALQYSQNCFPAGFRMLYSVFSIGFVFPFAAPYLSWQPNQTMKLLPWLDLSPGQLLKMKKLNSQNHIYYLDPQIDSVEVSF